MKLRSRKRSPEDSLPLDEGWRPSLEHLCMVLDHRHQALLERVARLETEVTQLRDNAMVVADG